MNKTSYLNNKWVLRLIALVFAVFLFIFVTTENRQFMQANRQTNTSVNVTETISNVPVIPKNLAKDKFVSGLKETADVRITGPRNIINQVIADEIYVETEDLSDMDVGAHMVKLVIGGATTKEIDYQITPSWTNIELGQLETVNLPITYELGQDLLEDGYQVTDVEIEPKEVTLTSRADIIQKIDKVEILILSLTPKSESFEEKYTIQVKDREGNLLDVNLSQPEASAQVNIQPQGKRVELRLKAQGQDDQYNYQFAFTNTSHVVLYGSEEDVKDVDYVTAIIDVSGLTRTGIRTAFVQAPEGVKVSLSQVPISVMVTEQPTEESESVNE